MVNVCGWVVLLAATEAVAWLKSMPWKRTASDSAKVDARFAPTSPTVHWLWMRTAALPVMVTTLAVAPLLLIQGQHVGNSAMVTVSLDPATIETQPQTEDEAMNPSNSAMGFDIRVFARIFRFKYRLGDRARAQRVKMRPVGRPALSWSMR